MSKLINKPGYQIKLQRLKEGGIVKAETGLKVYLNPKNWGVSRSYEKDENGNMRSFNETFGAARNAGEQEFLWNGNRYTTEYKHVPKDINQQDQLDIYHTFNTKNFDEFVNVMYPIFERALTSQGFGLEHIQNLLRQAGLESTYGTEPRGAKKFNLGGIKWVNNPSSRTYNYNHSTGPDGLEYVDFDSLQDYANYKVWLLNDTYKAFDAKDTNDFIERLHGKNPSKKHYSANKAAYTGNLNGMKSLDKAYNNYVVDRK